MDDSFTLLSSVSTKVPRSNKKHAPNKAPTRLALKRNIRRSTIFNNLPTISSINGLKVIEASETTTSVTSSSSQSNFVTVNDTPITISDSDSVKSETSDCNKESNYVEVIKQKRSSCFLSTPKYNAITKWISEIDYGTNNSNKSNAYQSVDILNAGVKTKRQNLFQFDDMLSSLKDVLKTPVSNKTRKEMVRNDLENKRSGANSNDGSDPHDDDEVLIISSSSDVVDDSDDSLELTNKKSIRSQRDLSSRLYGDKWKSASDLPKSEPRYRRNIRKNMDRNIPNTERKPNVKKSLLYKNPYLDSAQKQPSSLSKNEKPLESPWMKYLKGLCDSDTHSDNTSKRASGLLDGVSKLSLSFNDNEPNEKVFNRNELKEPNKTDFKLQTLHILADSFKESFYNSSENKQDSNINGLRKSNKVLVKSNNLNISADSDKENFSDFSDSSETLEDRLRKKLNLNKKTTKKFNDLKTSDSARLDLNKKTIISKEKPIKKLEDSFKTSTKLDVTKKNLISTGKSDRSTSLVSERRSKESGQNNKLLTKKDIAKSKTTNTDRKNKDLAEQIDLILNNVTTKTSSLKGTINSDDIVLKSFLASLSGSVKSTECDPSALIFRNNFKIYKNELATKLFKLYNTEIFDNRIPEDSPIEWSDRMRGTAGFCYCKKTIRSTGAVERKIRIVLATKVLDSADRLRDTLIHEMCHAAAWIINEVANGHGDKWRSWTTKARQIFPELPPIKVCHNYAINTKYTYKCIGCSYSFGRHTKSLDTERKRCGYCYGKFEIFINKTSKKGETKSVPVTPKKAVTGFALFVKENYASYKTPQLNHAQVMKLLGVKFNELRVSIVKEDCL